VNILPNVSRNHVEDNGILFFTLSSLNVKNLVEKFHMNTIFHSPFLLRTSCRYRVLHVGNVLQKTIVSIFYASIFEHNDRLRCEPPLIAHICH